MAKKTIVFKVVYSPTSNGVRTSAFARGSLCKVYAQGKVTHPIKGTQLLAFEKYQDARSFARAQLLPEIWMAEATGVKPCPYVNRNVIIGHTVSWQFARRFWQRMKANTLGYREEKDSPVGTVGCDTIKLLEKVS